jgi:hypothetical protein
VPVEFAGGERQSASDIMVHNPIPRKEKHKIKLEPPTLQVSIKFAVIVIAKDVSQAASVAKLPPRLLMLTGRI